MYRTKTVLLVLLAEDKKRVGPKKSFNFSRFHSTSGLAASDLRTLRLIDFPLLLDLHE